MTTTHNAQPPQQKITPDEAFSVCQRIISNQLYVVADRITLSSSFLDDLGMDSLDAVELMMAFEDAFKIELPDCDAEKFLLVKDAVEYAVKHAQPTAPLTKPSD